MYVVLKNMDDTVGSYETKFWQKKWIPIKASLSLMRIGESSQNANFKVEHGLAQKELVEWKYRELQSWVFNEPKLSFRYRENGEKYAKSWWFRTIRHTSLTDIYRQFYTGESYRTGRKMIPVTIEKYLTPLALAIWIMDDGSHSREVLTLVLILFSLRRLSCSKKSYYENILLNQDIIVIEIRGIE